jgi:hypothetical protein
MVHDKTSKNDDNHNNEEDSDDGAVLMIRVRSKNLHPTIHISMIDYITTSYIMHQCLFQ